MSITLPSLPCGLWNRAFQRALPPEGCDSVGTSPSLAAANMAVRGCTLASRAVLVVFFARFLSPAELGLYALFSVTIGLVLYLLGFDFYSYVTRELLAAPRDRWPAMLRDQAVFHVVCYVIVLPALLALFFSGVLPWAHAVWFYILLILEHISQELYRLLLTDSQSFVASVAHFLRAGAWVFAYVGIGLLHPEARILIILWLCWAAGSAVSIAVSLLALSRLPWRTALQSRVDFAWIRRGLGISGRLLAGTVALWSVTTFDRYLLRHYCGMEMVGVYSFYMSIASAIVVFVEAGVVAPLYPALVSAANRSLEEYGRLRRRFSLSVWLTSVGLAGAALAVIRPVLHFVNRPAYSEHLGILWAVLLFAVISLASRPAMYALYARKRDNVLVVTAVGGLAALGVAGPLLTSRYNVSGLAIAVCISMGVIGLCRSLCERYSEA